MGLENDIDAWQIDFTLFVFFFIGEGRQNQLMDPGMTDFEDADKITISVSKLIYCKKFGFVWAISSFKVIM